MSNHGPHFDEFRASPTHGHGGSEYDEFGKPTGSKAGTQASGESSNLHDHTTTSALHGAQWDDFGWKLLPPDHGHNFDSNFRAPAALDGDTGHGTWFDVFRGGTQVKAIANGRDVEGVVTNVRDDHVVVKLRDGRDLELGLQQLRAFKHVESVGTAKEDRKPTARVEDEGHVGPSTADAPSAHDATARGGGRRFALNADEGRKVLNKTDDDEVDVAKMAVHSFHTHSCKTPACGAAFHKTSQGMHRIYADREMVSTRASTTCHGCKAPLANNVSRAKVNKIDDQVDVTKIACENCGGAPAAHASSSGEKVCKPCMKASLSHGYDNAGPGEAGESRDQHISAGLASSAIHKTAEPVDVAKTLGELRGLVAAAE